MTERYYGTGIVKRVNSKSWMSYTMLEKALMAKFPGAAILFATSNQTTARIQLTADAEPKNFTGDFANIAKTLKLTS